MITIQIHEETETISDMVDLLREVADRLERSGCKIGYAPSWELSGEEERIPEVNGDIEVVKIDSAHYEIQADLADGRKLTAITEDIEKVETFYGKYDIDNNEELSLGAKYELIEYVMFSNGIHEYDII